MKDALKGRNANIEWLRVLAMFMVVCLHALGKGELLVSPAKGASGEYAAWILEALCICAVNVYVLISGYLLAGSSFKSGRILEIIAQVLFYAFFGLLVFSLVLKTKPDTYMILRNVFPFHEETYWFMTSYLIVYLLSPILIKGAKALSSKGLLCVIIIYGIYESVFKTVLPFYFTGEDMGYSPLWFIELFMIAAYLRLHGRGWLNTPVKGLVVYFVSVLLIVAEKIGLEQIYAHTGRLERLLGVPFHYNHVLVLTAAVGLFGCFINLKQREGILATVGCRLAPMTLGVYLLHEHVLIRYEWPKWLSLPKLIYGNPFVLIICVLLAVLLVYVIGTVVDFLRLLLFKAVKKIPAVGIRNALVRFDEKING